MGSDSSVSKWERRADRMFGIALALQIGCLLIVCGCAVVWAINVGWI